MCVNATLMKCIRHGKKERHNLHIYIYERVYKYVCVSAVRSLTGRSARVVCTRAGEGKYAFGDTWLPGSTHPPHLKGELPGDVGFDPLGLGEDPEALKWYVQAELVHARFAMLGTVGILVPEILTKLGVANIPVWFEAGKTPSLAVNFGALLTVQLILMVRPFPR